MGRLHSRLFAWAYDRCTGASEQAGMADMRADLLAGATGRTLEVGAGTGRNLGHYPPAVTELVLAEPSPFMAAKLRPKLQREATVLEAPAERLPFPDDDFDTVICTLVLCTVPDPAVAVAEISRVLRPGGRLLFLEHVRSGDPRIARRQDRFERPWRWIGDGCRCNRDTLATLEASTLEVERVEHGRIPRAPSIVEPLITGSARAT